MSTESHVLPVSGEHGGPGYVYFVAFVAAVGGFLFGYDLLIINGAQIFLRDYFHLTPGELGFATSSAILGCVAGPTLGASLCDRLGRRSTLIIAALWFAAGAVGTAVPSEPIRLDMRSESDPRSRIAWQPETPMSKALWENESLHDAIISTAGFRSSEGSPTGMRASAS